MKKTGFIIAVLSLLAFSSFAQRSNQKWYATAIGVRFDMGASNMPNGMGPSFEKFLSTTSAGEIFVVASGGSVRATGLLKYVAAIPDVPASLRWYIGGGVHLGGQQTTSFYTGLDGVLGIGYVFDDIPVNLNMDWQPVIHLYRSNPGSVTNPGGVNSFEPIVFGFTARYVIE